MCYSRCSHRVAVLEACFLNDVVDVGVGQSDGGVITVVFDDSSKDRCWIASKVLLTAVGSPRTSRSSTYTMM